MWHIKPKGENTWSMPKRKNVSKHHVGVIVSHGSCCLEGIMHVWHRQPHFKIFKHQYYGQSLVSPLPLTYFQWLLLNSSSPHLASSPKWPSSIMPCSTVGFAQSTNEDEWKTPKLIFHAHLQQELILGLQGWVCSTQIHRPFCPRRWKPSESLHYFFSSLV